MNGQISPPNDNGDDSKLPTADDIKRWGVEIGFQQVGITDTDLRVDENRLERWLTLQRHGAMAYMARHGKKRSRPALLVPDTVRIIAVRMNYLPEPLAESKRVLGDPTRAFVSRYALGRDYHKLMRARLKQLAHRIQDVRGPYNFRVFTDSAPVLERAIARKSGLGWIGKHTNLLNRTDGSYFFLGEIYTDLPLVIDPPDDDDHCGTCTACIDVCPTRAIVAPYELDARRCISYLTIESHDAIPEEYRALIGNRVFGCDDCQLFCPWNRFAKRSDEADYAPRHGLDQSALLDLFQWSTDEFERATRGSAMRRISYDQWQRNLAVALGNAPRDINIQRALQARLPEVNEMVAEHIRWALDQQTREP